MSHVLLKRPEAISTDTFKTLKRTVFASGRHCPAVMMSPSLGSKAGEQCTAMLLWRFSKRLNFLQASDCLHLPLKHGKEMAHEAQNEGLCLNFTGVHRPQARSLGGETSCSSPSMSTLLSLSA